MRYLGMDCQFEGFPFQFIKAIQQWVFALIRWWAANASQNFNLIGINLKWCIDIRWLMGILNVDKSGYKKNLTYFLKLDWSFFFFFGLLFICRFTVKWMPSIKQVPKIPRRRKKIHRTSETGKRNSSVWICARSPTKLKQTETFLKFDSEDRPPTNTSYRPTASSRRINYLPTRIKQVRDNQTESNHVGFGFRWIFNRISTTRASRTN